MKLKLKYNNKTILKMLSFITFRHSDKSALISPIIVGRLPWKRVLSRQSFLNDRITQYQLLTVFDVELGQTRLDTEIEYFPTGESTEYSTLIYIRHLIINAQAINDFMQSAEEEGIPFQDLGYKEFRKINELSILEVYPGANKNHVLELLDGYFERGEYEKPYDRIEGHLQRYLGPVENGNRFIDIFLAQNKPVKEWILDDFKKYLSELQKATAR